MVFGLGGPWTDALPGSTSKLNLTSVISGPGTDLAALPKTQHVMIKCTVTGGGLTKDHIYQSNADGTSWLDVSITGSHDHSSNTTGGSIVDIYRGNSKLVDLLLTKTNDLKIAQWVGTATTGGTLEELTDGTTGERSLRLRTNLTSGGGYMIQYPHLKINFAKRAMFQFKARIETLANLALRTGVNSDNVTAVDTNNAKFNAEICTVTNNNWQLRTASGTNKTMSDSGIAATTNRVGVRIEHLPDATPAETDMFIDASVVFRKTSDIPVTGASADNNLVNASVKNSTTLDRPYHIYGARVLYYISDAWT